MVTFQQCIDQVRSRLNIENNTNITDEEISIYLNFSFAELYGLIILSNEQWKLIRLNITVQNNTPYQLPDNFWKPLVINKVIDNSSGSVFPLPRVNIKDEGLFNSTSYNYNYTYNQVMGYGIEVNDDGYNILRVLPQTNCAGNYQVIYYPMFQDYNLNDEVIMGPRFQHWEEYGILDAMIKCCGKDETDPQLFILQKQAIISRLEAEASARDAGQTEPPQISSPWYDKFGGY